MIAMLLYRQLVSCGVPACQVAITCLEMAGKSLVLVFFKRLIIYSYITLALGLAINEPTLLGQIRPLQLKSTLACAVSAR
jgi:hypothetical protein